LEEKVSISLNLRPYPGIDPLPEGLWNGWWWLITLLSAALLMLIWWSNRRRRALGMTPERRLDEALAGSDNVTLDPSRRYERLFAAFRAYLAWMQNSRWKTLTGVEWDAALAEAWPQELEEGQLRALQEGSRRGEYVQFGQGKVSEEQLQEFAQLVRAFRHQNKWNVQESSKNA
jgi:hypothetical protein